MAIDFYDSQSQSYFGKTVGADSERILGKFVSRLSKGARILDVGCGSGRDLLWLRRNGFRPTGFERSTDLAGRAEEYSGCPVIRGNFLLYDFSCLRFEAILLVGALVHLEQEDLAPVLARIGRALISDGMMYLSLKEGNGRRYAKDGRVFTLWERGRLDHAALASGFEILDFSRDESAIGNGDVWLGYVLKRKEDVW